jgi:hypothetical protein
MTRRKREIIGLTNERDFPHLVELTFPPGGFRSVFLEIDAFHRDRRIPVRRGRNRHEVEQFHIRFCFPDIATADAFHNRFGGRVLDSHTGKAQAAGGYVIGLVEVAMSVAPAGQNRIMVYAYIVWLRRRGCSPPERAAPALVRERARLSLEGPRRRISESKVASDV